MTWNEAKTYGCRPSELLGIAGRLEAFYFDRALFTFGSTVQAELEDAQSGKGSAAQKQMRILMVMKRWTGVAQFR